MTTARDPANPAGGKRVTIRDVAWRAGVSTATVSRVITGARTVLPEARKAVEAAIEELGFVPNEAAQALRQGEKRLIGLLVDDLSNPYTVDVYRKQAARARELGYATLVVDAQGDSRLALEALRGFGARNVTGVVCTAMFDDLKEAGEGTTFPVVFMGRPTAGMNVLQYDATQALGDALSRLRELGHRRLGLTGFSRTTWLQSREPALMAAARELGFEPILEGRGMGIEDTYPAVQQLLQRTPRPTALFVQPHHAAPTAIRAIRGLGLRVPEDVSVVVFGDSEWAAAFTPPLAAIGISPRTVMVDWLVSICEGRTDFEGPAPVQPHYVERESVGPAPAL